MNVILFFPDLILKYVYPTSSNTGFSISDIFLAYFAAWGQTLTALPGGFQRNIGEELLVVE